MLTSQLSTAIAIQFTSIFAKIFEKHNELDDKIEKAESGEIPMDDLELETLKKQKLALKDEAYAMIIAYKKEHNL